MNDIDDTVRRHTAATVRLLLGSRAMKNGVSIVSGGPLDGETAGHLSATSINTGVDVVYLSFGVTKAARYGLIDITLFIARESTALVATGCRVWTSRSGSRAVIVPRENVRGHFRLAPRELIHKDGKPEDEEGYARAEALLAKLVGSDLELGDQATLHEVPLEA